MSTNAAMRSLLPGYDSDESSSESDSDSDEPISTVDTSDIVVKIQERSIGPSTKPEPSHRVQSEAMSDTDLVVTIQERSIGPARPDPRQPLSESGLVVQMQDRIVGPSKPESHVQDVGQHPDDQHETIDLTSEQVGQKRPRTVEEIDPLALLPPSPLARPDPEVQSRINACLQHQERGHSFNESLKRHEIFRNPYVLGKIVDLYGIDEHGTNFPSYLYNPKRFAPNLFYDELAKERRREETRIQEEMKNRVESSRSQIGFHAGPTLKPETGPAKADSRADEARKRAARLEMLIKSKR